MKSFLSILLIILASVNVLMARFALFRLHRPGSPVMWMIKVFISALSPVLFLIGIITALLGIVVNSLPAIAIGTLSCFLYLIHIISISLTSFSASNMKSVFGEHLNKPKPGERNRYFLRNRYAFILPGRPHSIVNQNISFHTITTANRELLCDIWQPPKNISHSGLAIIYLHGSAWTLLDKDVGTRIFFRHLASQGHVIMDVAYRLFPEADFMGMVHDAKRAIAWIKANAGAFGINPDKIVIGGGSAGAHIALLAAYTCQDKQFMPSDLEYTDLTVSAVISWYGQPDLVATYYHTCQQNDSKPQTPKKKKPSGVGMPQWLRKIMGDNYHRLNFDNAAEPGKLAPILGGSPDESPGAYALFSPVNHVHKHCPPTLILHGKHDVLAPVTAIRYLHTRLVEAGVPVIMHLIPQTDHAFDLILPGISPSAHNAIYETERFLEIIRRS